MDVTITTTTFPTTATVNPISIETQLEPRKRESDNLESNLLKDEEIMQLTTPANISIEQQLDTQRITTTIPLRPIGTSKILILYQ